MSWIIPTVWFCISLLWNWFHLTSICLQRFLVTGFFKLLRVVMRRKLVWKLYTEEHGTNKLKGDQWQRQTVKVFPAHDTITKKQTSLYSSSPKICSVPILLKMFVSGGLTHWNPYLSIHNETKTRNEWYNVRMNDEKSCHCILCILLHTSSTFWDITYFQDKAWHHLTPDNTSYGSRVCDVVVLSEHYLTGISTSQRVATITWKDVTQIWSRSDCDWLLNKMTTTVLLPLCQQ